MASRAIGTSLVVVVVAVLWARAAAQSSDCTSVLISMSPCLNYISGNSSTPSSGCCSQLASVVRSKPQCLCEVLNGGGSSLGIDVNQTRALALPAACNVQTPPLSRCNAASPQTHPREHQNLQIQNLQEPGRKLYHQQTVAQHRQMRAQHR
ncbi:bifunctional inhibitor/lipid-transfer protein/seed storage 2S albumin superfamily protein [Actinidia rufa]|uniref:Bifunctional inhibitor/lipid-transfer protein/seed storage 2S albumin superfamily protein n=1 Tax=Actinidia rufa TaxID=165716 RepID=A0A7J0DLC4_9ERIC|nr:bifunctional inhibitor/lipid-transfer protein/seed storage 2S albumin superfamily protein [Actinidia rufa]